jgi:hypothetical protein
MKKIIQIVLIVLVIIGAIYFIKNKKTEEAPAIQPSLYDSVLSTKYIKSQGNWPPEVKFDEGKEFTCKENGTPAPQGSMTVKKTLAYGVPYCVTEVSEGAAGSTYTTYTYVTDMEGAVATLQFTLQFLQCENYDNPQKKECVSERATFNPDTLASTIVDASR